MIGEAPKYKWDKYLKETGEILVAVKKWREREFGPYVLWGLDDDAPDEIKIEYEKWQKQMFNGLARFYVPDMKAPYYTWEGKVVERSSLEGRELPLAD